MKKNDLLMHLDHRGVKYEMPEITMEEAAKHTVFIGPTGSGMSFSEEYILEYAGWYQRGNGMWSHAEDGHLHRSKEEALNLRFQNFK